MGRQKVKSAVLIGAVAALVAAVGPAGPAVATGGAGEPHTVVVDCSGQPQVRPSSYLIACGDGNNGLVSLEWTQWGAASAEGRGSDVVNDCIPYCAAGRFHTYPVTVRLDTVRPRPGQSGQPYFTVLHVHYTADTPARTPRDATYSIVGV
ncbi:MULTISPECIES: hypothetical protein [unclassified Streptomyces]|uniref:hypothetical protein n=1 Tax=unclassified Streptomyces TaxID=2593676 RepID=UPI000C27E5CB|nr:hypothetical protein [Streptomyces sp. CB01201]MBX7470646.1 hypothetical protein [Streptomyces sp. MAG02]PJN01137.1 hypothetical protein CG740_20895 [Streptomyces sp. CB01201]